jgi:hypothetical protein
MTQPASQPTMTAVAPAAPEAAAPAQQPVPHAPSFVACCPHAASTDVTIQWGPPNEGPADSYKVECAGSSLDVDGTTTEVILRGLAPDTMVSAKVTATTGSNSGFLETPEVKVNHPDAPANTAPPA